ncbi:peptidoglycan DD-metalloendopeptidase family protein [Anaeromicrobium sediminis]|uniref:Peptidase M23 n=1 Tax=Anaeromicrobium sediminis TaxID=1478221 RepID=A0A267MGG4_9FIRM|nr:peptidoglycan DD-metalloendopeptidase family protein [Anaeromicrobium sediminis]PAB58492.1 hypothetical protein CCE28_15435 [Anaeromicrobium sediminis]
MKIEEVSGKLKKLSKKQKIGLIGTLSLCLILMSTFLYINSMAFEVKSNGKTIAIVKEKEDFQMALESVKENMFKAYGKKIVFDEVITYERVKVDKEKIADLQGIKKAILRNINLEVMASGIWVDDKCVVALSTKSQAEEVLKEIKSMYKPDEKAKVEKYDYAENIKIDKVQIKGSEVKDVNEAISLILKGTDEEKTHKVEKGESFWTIAKKYKISVEDLTKANMDVKPEKLQIGQSISLIVPKALLTVETITNTTFEKKIPYEVEFEDTSALYKGEKKVKKKGKNGVKEVLAQVVTQNGIQVAMNVVSENVVSSPVTQIVLKGTKKVPPRIGTGTFIKPTRGRLSSKFGWRWGRRHTGIDIAAPYGTPVIAADGGKVTFSGWKSGYGYLVIIDHGSNTVTYYAHNSKLLVKKGQKVFKGQKIALVGSTGRSTGPHVHFEVRKNKVPVNPLKYVKY